MIRKSTIIIFLIFCLLFPRIMSGQAPESKLTPEDYIELYQEIAVKKRMEYKIPASITLAQGILESGFGNSVLAQNANNHFGIKCHLGWTGDTYLYDDDEKDECFRKYDNPEASFDDHSLFLTSRSRYDFLFYYKVTDYKKWAYGLKKAGYATNPKYPMLLIDLIERYELAQYDTMSLEDIKAKQKSSELLIAGNEQEKSKPESGSDNKQHQKEFERIKEPGEAYVSTQDLVVKTRNRIKYVVARRGDTPHSIAEELNMWQWQVKKYNELDNGRTLEAGDIVYLQPKRRKGVEKYHIAKPDESMYSISQQYGIKLKHLYRLNRMEAGSKVKTGQKIWLHRKKPANQR